MNAINRETWNSRTVPDNKNEIIRKLKKYEKDDDSEILALVSIVEDNISAYVLTPTGILYEFKPNVIENDWWFFALRNYYVIYGSKEDKKYLINKFEIVDKVKTKIINNKLTTRTNLSLEDLLKLID